MASMCRQGFIFRAEYYELFKQLDIRQRGLLISAMIEYHECGNDGFLKDRSLRMVFAVIKGLIDSDKASMADVSEKRRAAAQARWQNMQTMQNANACFASDEAAGECAGAPACACKEVLDNQEELLNQEKEENVKKKKKVFEPPTVEEVRAYCLERKNGIDAEKFVAFYEAKGWMIGKNRMKNWRSAVVTWERGRIGDGFEEKKKVSLKEVNLL